MRRNELNFTTHIQVREWYDRKYAEMGGCWHTPEAELNEHLDALGLTPGSMLLDLGCGDGSLLVQARNRGAHVFGCDVSRYAVEACRAKGIFSDCRQMESLLWMNEFFDFCVSLGSIEHALDIPKAVHEMARVLKPRGRWLLYVPNEEWKHEDQPLETTMTGVEWAAILEEAGLTVEKIEKIRDNNRITGSKP